MAKARNTIKLSGGGVGTLQEVLTEGDTATDKSIFLQSATDEGLVLEPTQVVIRNNSLGDIRLGLNIDRIFLINDTLGGSTSLIFEDTTNSAELIVPNENGTLATQEYVQTPVNQTQTQRSVSTSGTDVINNSARNIVFIHEAGATTTLTINLPATPVDSQIVTIMSVGGIVGLTLSTAVGTIIGTITALTALQSVKFIWVSSESKWYKIN
jgi:hypothetical protein